MSASMSLFALALGVVTLAALALLIWLTIANKLSSELATMRTSLREWSKRVEETQRQTHAGLQEMRAATPAKLAAEVADLADAVQRLGDTHRKFAGKVWQRIGEHETAGNGPATDDADLAALLALQGAAPRAS